MKKWFDGSGSSVACASVRRAWLVVTLGCTLLLLCSASVCAAQDVVPLLIPLGNLSNPLAVVAMTTVAAVLINEDLACIGIGLLIAQGMVNPGLGLLACYAGVFTGDLLWFWAGRFLGRPALVRRPFRWVLNPEDVTRSALWFRRRGPWIIFMSRAVPGTRAGTCFTSGVLSDSPWRFPLYFALAATLWVPAVVWTSAVAGIKVMDFIEATAVSTPVALAALAFGLLVVLEVLIPVSTREGRVLLHSRLHRLSHLFRGMG